MPRGIALLALLGGVAQAAGPKLTPDAAALLARSPAFVSPQTNLILSLQPPYKAVSLFLPAPRRIQQVTGVPFMLLVDDDVLAVAGGKLKKIAYQPGERPAATPDGKLVVGVLDKRGLKITQEGAPARTLRPTRDDRYEIEHPWITPDGKRVLAVVRDWSQTEDVFSFLMVDVASGALDEVKLARAFVPGTLRQALSPTRVAVQMTARAHAEDDPARAADVMVFDFTTRMVEPAPSEIRPGRPSPSGQRSLLEGPIVADEDRRCAADATLIYEAGKKPAQYRAGAGTVVTLLDFLPDESAAIAQVLTLKGCKARGVLIPLHEENPAKWKPFPLPPPPNTASRPSGFVLVPAAAPATPAAP